MATVKIGTRGSQLALFQANAVAALLRERAGTAGEIVVIRTSGDRLADANLAQIGGKRLFVKEIEDALLAGAVDLAVHSSKDMPALLPEGLTIGAVLPREDARDAVVLPQTGGGAGAPGLGVEDVLGCLGEAPRIGTSSVRRSAQLRRLLPQAHFEPIRGNLDTRLRKLDTGACDALVLAAAGLSRLGYQSRISAALPPEEYVPAPGQGIIAVEIRTGDRPVQDLVARIDDPAAAAALTAERAVVTALGGGCQMPIGAYASASTSASSLALVAVVLSIDGTREVRAATAGAVADATGVGRRAAERLLAGGAAEILAEVERTRAAVEGLQP